MKLETKERRANLLLRTKFSKSNETVTEPEGSSVNFEMYTAA